MFRETNDNALVFTLEEALSEIRALRSQKRALARAVNIMRCYVEPHPSWQTKQRLDAAQAAIDPIRSLLSGSAER